jgi:hypothetical protein
MNEKGIVDHPGVTRLADYKAGLLEPGDAAAVRGHIEGCPLCRLELKRLERFERIGEDESLLEEAGWRSAEIELEKAFRENVLPKVAERKVVKFGGRRSMRLFGWLVPVAAAAAVLVLFVQLERVKPIDGPYIDGGPMRGEPAGEYVIMLETPSGEMEESPAVFTWHSRREIDYYTLEIFTSNLVSVHKTGRIAGSEWSVPDSLGYLLTENVTYLWNVRGYWGLGHEVLSPSEWFRIIPEQLK